MDECPWLKDAGMPLSVPHIVTKIISILPTGWSLVLQEGHHCRVYWLPWLRSLLFSYLPFLFLPPPFSFSRVAVKLGIRFRGDLPSCSIHTIDCLSFGRRCGSAVLSVVRVVVSRCLAGVPLPFWWALWDESFSFREDCACRAKDCDSCSFCLLPLWPCFARSLSSCSKSVVKVAIVRFPFGTRRHDDLKGLYFVGSMLIIFVTTCGTDKGIPASLSRWSMCIMSAMCSLRLRPGLYD